MEEGHPIDLYSLGMYPLAEESEADKATAMMEENSMMLLSRYDWIENVVIVDWLQYSSVGISNEDSILVRDARERRNLSLYFPYLEGR